MPFHCARCGAPHIGPLKNCDGCRASQKAWKDARRRERLTAATPRDTLLLIEALTRRIGSLEIAVARLQLDGKDAYNRGYRAGFGKGRNGLARNLEWLLGRFAAHRDGEQTSLEELATVCHAYQRAGAET